jgi:hypothetical protein
MTYFERKKIISEKSHFSIFGHKNPFVGTTLKSVGFPGA